MNDRAVELLEQYDLEIVRTRKGRGSILVDTPQETYVFAEYSGTEEHLAAQNRLLTLLSEKSTLFSESIVSCREGTLSVKDQDEVRYTLKTWQEGRECNPEERWDCLEAMGVLAELHNCLESVAAEDEGLPSFAPGREYEKRNRELRRVRKYLKQRGSKQPFERMLGKVCDDFSGQGERIASEWEQVLAAGNPSGRRLCHGDFQYHNLVLTKKGWFLQNFERCCLDSPVRDLSLFLRKILEKENWSVPLGRDLLAAYEEKRRMTNFDRMDLYYRLSYPEKFWKIANFYMNASKSWIPGKNTAKLERVIAQEEQKQTFLQAVFHSEASFN